jgi:cytochrome c-type biogenesis protein CcmE
MVKQGSIVRQPDGVSVAFTVTDGPADVSVRYRGIVPDLFKEGGGVVAEGRLERGGTFVADTILAKHDERYMPPQMGNLQAERKTRETVAQ